MNSIISTIAPSLKLGYKVKFNFISSHILIMLFSISFKLASQGNNNFQDCVNAFPICEMKTYHFGQMNGHGKEKEVPLKSACFDQSFTETNSFWLQWKAVKSGTLTFVINPNNENDDFDFVLFKRSKGDCSLLKEVRCMAAGENIGAENNENIRCKGRTGLSFSSVDEFEQQGCKYSSDNFLKMLHTEIDEEYVLQINNYNSTEGFSITFEGETILYSLDDCKTINISEPIMIVNLYPNPAVNSINLEYLAGSQQNVDIEIMDIAGKLIQSFNVVPELGRNKTSFQLTSIPKGSYLLRLKQDKFTTTKQFVKQ